MERVAEKESLLDSEWTIVKVPSVGLRHYTGISSSYSLQYPNQLVGIISKEEYIDAIKRLNETIRDYWPCGLCYFFGYGCSICTFGLSILIPNYCATYSEIHAISFLKNLSYKAKYYDRKISFTLIKNFCSSYVEIKYPTKLSRDLEQQDSALSFFPIDNTMDSNSNSNWAIPSPLTLMQSRVKEQ